MRLWVARPRSHFGPDEVSVLYEHQPAGPDRFEETSQSLAPSLGQVRDDEAGVDQIEPERQYILEQVGSQYFDSVVSQRFEQRRVEVDGGDCTAGTDAFGKPSGDRSTAAANLEAPPTRTDT